MLSKAKVRLWPRYVKARLDLNFFAVSFHLRMAQIYTGIGGWVGKRIQKHLGKALDLSDNVAHILENL